MINHGCEQKNLVFNEGADLRIFDDSYDLFLGFLRMNEGGEFVKSSCDYFWLEDDALFFTKIGSRQ